MSQENVDIVGSVFSALNRRDLETAFGFADPEIVVDATRRVFNPTTYTGFEGLRQMQADLEEVWEEFRFERSELIDAGDRVVVIGHLRGKGKGSGAEVEQPIAGIWTVRDGRVVRIEIGYTDPSEALEVAGLRE